MKIKARAAILTFLVLLMILLFSFCTGNESSKSLESRGKADEKILSIASASSLRFALSKISEEFEKESKARVIITFSSSGNLANQIKNGAPYDIFISANKLYVDQLSEEGFIESREKLLKGFIVIASRKSEVEINNLEDLRKKEIKKIAIANPEHAPFGFAAKEALERAGLWNELKDKIVYAESASQAMHYILTGNAEAGIIPLSLCTEELECVNISSELYSDVFLYLAIIKGSENKELAREFAAYLKSEKAREIFKDYGYELL